MFAKINLEALHLASTEYLTREDFDTDPYSPKMYELNASMVNPSLNVKLLRYDREPEKFPCLMFDCGIQLNRGEGPDIIRTLYIYDYELTDE